MSPYFNFESEEEEEVIDQETIEGLALQTLVEKYNLTTQWSYEGFIWGSSDENGTFNGVVGRVTVQSSSYYFFETSQDRVMSV